MEIQIQVLSVSTETKPTAKGSYQMLEVAYKDLSNGGKVSAKKLMSFTNKEVFSTLATAKAADVYDVVMEKGEKYWDWVKVTKSVAQAGATSNIPTRVGTAQSVRDRGFETPEERKLKQIYIIKQSSLNVAVQALTVGTKTAPKAVELIEYAKELEQYVFGLSIQEVVSKDVETIETMDEDIPY